MLQFSEKFHVLLSLVTSGLILGLAALCLAAEQDQDAKQPPAKAKKSRDRYPLPYPPTLPDGKTSVTEMSPEMLKPGPNLRLGVEIAKIPPQVDFLFYPEQNYPGNPWSHRSDGIVIGDKYYSSSNDHLAPRGTALLWEYDSPAKTFRLLCNTTKFLESVNAFPADMNYRPGEMQSRIDLGNDGWLYYCTDRGSPTVTNDAHGYKGEWILRTNPQTLETQIVATYPIEKHTIPASVLDPQRMILYCGTAVGKDAPNQKIQFFAFDVKNKKMLKVADDGPTRTLIFSKSTGRVFWEGKMYDPATNEITPANVPHVRSASQETPQGLVYGTSGTKADLWSYNVKTNELRQLGTAAVATQEYISSIEADPSGRYLYYVPGAHGGAAKDGTPVVQYDVATGKKKVLAFLHDLFWEKYGYALDGSFGSALDEKGERLFISWDGWRKGQPRGWESVAMTVLHIPGAERTSKPPAVMKNKKYGVGLRLDARTLFESSSTDNLQLSKDGKSLKLCEGVLIENDGPAAGFSYQPNEEILAEGTVIRKSLAVRNAKPRGATLLVGGTLGGPGNAIQATVNNSPVKLEAAEPVGRHWQAFRFDPKSLKNQDNEIMLSGVGKVWIARADKYAAGSVASLEFDDGSSKSTDHGKTWYRLGSRNDIKGEYSVRLFLDQYVSQGTLLSPVIDLRNLAAKAIPSRADSTGPVEITLVGPQRSGDSIVALARFGTTFDYREETWSRWQDLSAGAGVVEHPKGRYMRLALFLNSHDQTSTPEIREIVIGSPTQATHDWTEKLRVIENHNEQIARTSIPFSYEPFEHADLKTLREQYHLDDVVDGAKDELELITRLAAWSARQWDKGHLAESYPPWNALEILKPHADGTPVGGFCQQYNLVFLQACESFGLPGRAVSISQGGVQDKIPGSGHEVVEIWSNQFRKWIYIDGNYAWYAVDAESRVPLSLWELRERQLAILAKKAVRPTEIIKIAASKYDWKDLTSWPPFVELRMIPRSNFLERRNPLPLNQGMRGWFWTGHYVWTDDDAPAALIYGNRVTSRTNWNWTLNQAHFVLEPTSTPGELRVYLDTSTPGFETFLAEIDGGEKMPVTSGFLWKLHEGQNRLQVRPRNKTGREGIVSWIVLDYSP